jgi:hypothetical protein
VKKTKNITKKVKPKSRHIMSPSKRTTQKKTPTENRWIATYGEKLKSPAISILSLLQQIAGGGSKQRRNKEGELDPKGEWVNVTPHLALCFAKDIWDIVQSKDGSILRDMADLIEAPVSRPALAEAWSLREYWTPCMEAGFNPPQIKKEKIISAIMETTGCNLRTAEKAATEAGLGKVFKWKAGRPRTQE